MSNDQIQTPDVTTRAQRYREALTEHRWQEPIGSDSLPDTPPDRFLLVQRSRITGLYWADFGETLQAVLDSHDCDEYPEDWLIEYALDLDNGRRYRLTGVTTTSYMEPEDGEEPTADNRQAVDSGTPQGTPRLLVVIEGGLVQGVVTDDPAMARVDVLIRDEDTMEKAADVYESAAELVSTERYEQLLDERAER